MTRNVLAIGPLSLKNGTGRHYKQESRSIALAPEQIPHVNATMKAPYTGPAWNIREGGEAHKQHKSHGIG